MSKMKTAINQSKHEFGQLINSTHEIAHTQGGKGFEVNIQNYTARVSSLFHKVSVSIDEIEAVSEVAGEFTQKLPEVKRLLNDAHTDGAEAALLAIRANICNMSLKDFTHYLEKTVNKQVINFESTNNSARGELKAISRELRLFNEIKGRENSSKAFVSLLSHIYTGMRGIHVHDLDDRLQNINELIEKMNAGNAAALKSTDTKKPGLAGVVYDMSYSYATIKLAADIRKAIHDKGYTSAIKLLDSATADDYKVPLHTVQKGNKKPEKAAIKPQAKTVNADETEHAERCRPRANMDINVDDTQVTVWRSQLRVYGMNSGLGKNEASEIAAMFGNNDDLVLNKKMTAKAAALIEWNTLAAMWIQNSGVVDAVEVEGLVGKCKKAATNCTFNLMGDDKIEREHANAQLLWGQLAIVWAVRFNDAVKTMPGADEEALDFLVKLNKIRQDKNPEAIFAGNEDMWFRVLAMFERFHSEDFAKYQSVILPPPMLAL